MLKNKATFKNIGNLSISVPIIQGGMVVGISLSGMPLPWRMLSGQQRLFP